MKDSPFIVFISGKMGSGKSTLASLLNQKLGPLCGFRLKFAEIIYQMHDQIRHILDHRLGSIELPDYDWDVKDGKLLQLLGSDWGRAIDSDIWVKCLLNKIRNLPREVIAIVEDGRFENEFDAIKRHPRVITIRLECDRDIRKNRCFSWREKEDHESEIGLDLYSARGKFDIVCDSGKMSANEIAKIVIEAIGQKKLTEEK